MAKNDQNYELNPAVPAEIHLFKGLRLTAGRRRTWVREFWVEAVGVARGVCGVWFR